MVAWIALFISILGLIVTIIAERGKLLEALNDYRAWHAARKQKKNAMEAVAKFNSSPEGQNRRQDKVPLKTFYAFLFFPFSVSSAILGIVGLQTTLLTTIIATFAFIPLLILGFIGFTRGEKERGIVKWIQWFLILFGLITVFASLGLIWGLIAIQFTAFELPIFWGGIISGICLPLLLWAVQFTKLV